MFPISKDELQAAMTRLHISDITKATIRQIVALAGEVEKIAGEKIVHLELGNPGIPANQVGVEAEREALAAGIANQYPNIEGLPALKENGSKFIKAFLNAEIPSGCIVPTVGSMQGSFATMFLLAHRDKSKDTILFINPGFPAQHYQAQILGMKKEAFDIYSYRGKALEAKLEEYFKKGNITALLYGTPNNPAWINLTDEELEIIGRLATKYDVVVMEDMAYAGMDFRQDFSHPGVEPFIPTVCHYTDNYILMISASKIFSYAGQRMAMVCFSPALADRYSEELDAYFGMGEYLRAFVYGVLYALSSGTAHSAQYAFAAMLGAAAEGKINFIEDCREYGRRGALAKGLFEKANFELVYAKDGEQPISDGFFFTAVYPGMNSHDLQAELMRYGIASISLPTTGSEQHGLRVCISMLDDDKHFEMLESRLTSFDRDHK